MLVLKDFIEFLFQGNGKKDMCAAASAIEGCVRTEANKVINYNFTVF